jgi:hypothetical protein
MSDFCYHDLYGEYIGRYEGVMSEYVNEWRVAGADAPSVLKCR